MRALVLASLLVVQASAASAGVTYLNCTIQDLQEKQSVWALKLNEEAGTVQVTLEATTFDKPAVYLSDSITFQLLSAAININRINGTMTRTLADEDGQHISKGKCVVSGLKRAF